MRASMYLPSLLFCSLSHHESRLRAQACLVNPITAARYLRSTSVSSPSHCRCFWSLLGLKDGCVRVRLRAASTLRRLRRLQTTRPAVKPALKVAAPTITSTAIGHSTSSHGCHPTLCLCVSPGSHLDCPRLMICPNTPLQASKAERPTITTGTGLCLESLVLRDTQHSH